jgi:ubiquitin fusion degradation protein 1
MMNTLKLNEGDPIRINGAALPKGKMVKIQAQSTEFLQVSDPKAVYVYFTISVIMANHQA